MDHTFLSDNSTGGGIAFNVKSLSKQFEKYNLCAHDIYLSQFKWRQFVNLLTRGDILYATSLKSLFVASFVSSLRFVLCRRTVIVQIVYHPRFADPDVGLFRRYVNLILSFLSPSNVIYYSVEAKRATGLSRLKGDDDVIGLCSSFQYVGCEECKDFFNSDMSSGSLILTTVARFVEFKKGYLVGLIKFAKENRSVKLNVIGYGDIESELVSIAGDADNILFLGERSLSQVKYIVSKSDIFIGMGTTLVDAAYLNIPAISVVESSCNAQTTGFFDPFAYSYGESVSDQRYIELDSFLIALVEGRTKPISCNNSLSVLHPAEKVIASVDRFKSVGFLKSVFLASLIFVAFFIRPITKKDYH